MRTSEILEAIQQRAGKKRLDGHPLYAYRVTEDELRELRVALQNEIRRDPELPEIEQRAAFCLFGAEWFCRNHVEGRWKWDTIVSDGLNLSGYDNERFHQRVRGLTDDGLKWWHVQLIRTETANWRLISLACQGGLPLKSLKSHTGRLRSFFKATLRHHERYRTEPLDEVVAEYLGYLPATLNNDGVQELSVQIVEAVSRLRRESADYAASGITRQEYLDRHIAGWRDTIPVRLDDVESLALVLGLLDQEATKAVASTGLTISTTLRRENSGFSIARSLNECEHWVDEDRLLKWLELSDPNQLHPRMSVYLQSSADRIRVATISKSSAGEKYNIARIPHEPLTCCQSSNMIHLVVTAVRNEVARVVVPGGEELGQSPWVFSDDDEQELIGVGSVRTRRPSVLVAVPADAELDASSTSHCQLSEEKVCGRTLVSVSGTLSVIHDGAVVRVQTGVEKEQASFFKLVGHNTTLNSKGRVVWLGVPRISEYRLNDDGFVSHVPKDQIRWRHVSDRTWQQSTSMCRGDVVLRVERNGESVFQTTATVLPSGFMWKLVPGKERTGCLTLCNLIDAEVFPADCDGVLIDVARNAGQFEINVDAAENRPATLQLRVKFNGGGETELHIPCPTRSIALKTAAGRVVASDIDRSPRLIPLSDLDGLFLEVIGADQKTLHLVDAEEQQFLAQPEPTGTEGIREIPLSSIQNYVAGLLAQSDKPDGFVELQLLQPPRPAPAFKFKVSRFAGTVEKEPGEGFIDVFVENETLVRLGVEAESLTCRIAPLGDPDDVLPPEAIVRSGEARWRVYDDTFEPGPYLVTVWLNEFTCLRPLRISVRMTEVIQQEFSEAIPEEQFYAALNPCDKDERRFAWDQFADALALDHSHPGWQKVDVLLRASQTLPITTFEAVAAIARNPEAVARVAIDKPKQGWLWQKLKELPFLWSLIPVSAWVAAARRYETFIHERCRIAGFTGEEAKDQFQKRLKDFADGAVLHWRGATCVLTCMHFSGITMPSGVLTPQLLMPNSRDTLLARRVHEYGRLIDAHDRYDTRQSWPHFWISLNDEIRASVSSIEVQDRYPNEWSVLNAPAIAAACGVYDIPCAEALVKQLKKLRGVDPDWFDAANEIAMFIFAGERLAQDPKCFS